MRLSRIILFLSLFIATLSAAPPPKAVESFVAAWEIIRDTHFDTNYNGHDWNKVKADFLPRVEKAVSQEEVREAIQAMLQLLGHSHLMVIPGDGSSDDKDAEAGEPGTSGIEVRVLENQIVVFRVERGSTAEKAGVKPGMVLKEIDGKSALDEIVSKVPGKTREFLLWHHAWELLKGSAGSECKLLLANEKMIRFRRGPETGEPAKLGNLPTMYTRVATDQLITPREKKVGYLRFNLWMLPAIKVINEFVDKNRNSDAIIVDLRGNLGGIGGMVMGAAGHFLTKRASLGRMKLRDNEINFIATPRPLDSQARPTNVFQGKLAILTDAITLSSAELFAGGMQEMGRGRVFGERTGGQALPAVSDRLPNGDLLYHAVADFTTPNGHRLEENGVVPDVFVPLKLEALRSGKDEALTAALIWIESAPQSGGSSVK